ncbi:MAG TPA: TetR/AcrR family transcriptional regulator [Actinomycetes bacterium]|nr:TetR/AcrR family transcriptional regulator [Actinomycetes bacterium]
MTTMSDARPGPAKGPGRPRSERAHEAILNATLELLLEEGFTRMSIEAVGKRAGVGKATIYRRWPSKADLVVGAVAAMKEQPLVDPDRGSVREDLLFLARQAFRPSESGEVTELMLRLASARAHHPELQEAFMRHIVAPRRQIVADVLRRGVERGEIRADIDIELALDVLMGFVSYRHMISARRPSYGRGGLEGVIDVILDGIATPEAKSAHGGASSRGAGAGGRAPGTSASGPAGTGGRAGAAGQPRASSSSR